MAAEGSASTGETYDASWEPIAVTGPASVEIHGVDSVWLVFPLNKEPPPIWTSSFERQPVRALSSDAFARNAPAIDGATICWVVADDDAVRAAAAVHERIDGANRAYSVYLRAKAVEQQQASIHQLSDHERIRAIEARLQDGG